MSKPIHDRGASVKVAHNAGSIRDIETYPPNRRCKKCNASLTIYTPGYWCHAHMRYGFKIEQETEDLRKTKVQNKWLIGKRRLKNKDKVKVSPPLNTNASCTRCQNRFRRRTNSANILTHDLCYPCRKIERRK